ncbi:MAG: methyltransferase domain-containing protein [Lachnospiraceae bacterium]|nr:methyltransferase domain-containing protein [Lachnospiraceae bacterium]
MKVVEDTLNYYNKNAREFADGTVNVNFTEIQDLFLKYVPEGGKILDFGCGSGRDTKYFLNKGYNVDAIDGSDELCKIACNYTGISVKKMKFEELDCIGVYDGIWACASILHVANKELPAILRKMTDAIKNGGVIYTSFKYGEFEGYRNGRYFTYHTEESFRKIIEDIPKLAIERLWISDDVRTERREEQWLNLILRKQTTD